MQERWPALRAKDEAMHAEGEGMEEEREIQPAANVPGDVVGYVHLRWANAQSSR